AIAEVDHQLDELAGSRNELHSFHNPDTDVDLLKMVDRDFGFDGSGNETGHGLCSIEAIATASISIRYSGRARAETAMAVTDGAGSKAQRRCRICTRVGKSVACVA